MLSSRTRRVDARLSHPSARLSIIAIFRRRRTAGEFHRLRTSAHLWPGIRPPTKRRCRNEATPFRFEPSLPIRFQITDVRHRRASEIWRRRETPTHHCQFTLAIGCRADNWCHHVGEDGRKARQITGQIALDAEQAPHGLLAAGDAVEIAILGKEPINGHTSMQPGYNQACAIRTKAQ
jgi:hypothetical protein